MKKKFTKKKLEKKKQIILKKLLGDKNDNNV